MAVSVKNTAREFIHSTTLIALLAGLALAACSGIDFRNDDNDPAATATSTLADAGDGDASPTSVSDATAEQSSGAAGPTQAADSEEPPAGASLPLTINVTISASGYDADVIRVPVGQPVKLVFRNRDSLEHHFLIEDMPASDRYWQTVGERQMSLDEFLNLFDDDYEAPEEDEHDQHHPPRAYTDEPPCASEFDICPTGEWVHAHAAAGANEIVLFTPTSAGTYTVICPLHGDHVARVIVY